MSSNINTVDLTPLKNELSEEELQEYDMGEIVSTPDGAGIIAGFAEEPFEYPAGGEDRIERIEEEEEIDDEMIEEIDASENNPYYIVALQDGGSIAVTADEISSGTLEDDDGADIEEWGDVTDSGEEADLAPVYQYCDNPNNRAELEKAKVKYIHENYATELAQYVDNNEASLATLEELSSEELVNIRGVDDPHVGFNRLPPGWTRKSVLQAWASLGGMWRTCFARMLRVRGPNFAKRFCAALKDEVLRTEEWRNSF